MKGIKRILLVDDNDADNDFHQFVIQQTDAKMQVKIIDDSRKALVYFEQCLASENNPDFPVPDVLFLDINMPAMTGFELLDKLRQLPDPYNHLHQIKIFMLTGSLNPDDSNLAKDRFSDLVTGFQIKPLTQYDLTKIDEQYY